MVTKKWRNAPEKAKRVYRAAKHIHDQERRYVYGGGHKLLQWITAKEGLDCSSSVSLALSRAGLFRPGMAIVSGAFANWGVPGQGKYFTVWYNWQHVWIQFHGLGHWWRFDTSPWGSGGYGPRMRVLPRSTRGFKARHWPDL